jgi:hypothetical protein
MTVELLVSQITKDNFENIQQRFILLKYFCEVGGNILLQQLKSPVSRNFLPNNFMRFPRDIKVTIERLEPAAENQTVENWFEQVTHLAKDLLEVIVHNIGDLNNKKLLQEIKETAILLMEKSGYEQFEAVLFPSEGNNDDSDPTSDDQQQVA